MKKEKVMMIERQTKKLWRIVERSTTPRGLARHKEVIAPAFPSYRIARDTFEMIKLWGMKNG